MRIIVSGLIARYPLGGMSWHYLQYLLGFRSLGHDVYYFEDSQQWPYDPIEDGTGRDCSYNVDYLAQTMKSFGLRSNWAYHFVGGRRQDGTILTPQWFGLSDSRRTEVTSSADLLVNVSRGIADLSAFDHVPIRAHVDTDPVFTQLRMAGAGDPADRRLVEQHTCHFTFGERIGEKTPPTGHDWKPTRQPISMDQWSPANGSRDTFTTVMNWTSYKPVEFDGVRFHQKDEEFKRFLDLPRLSGAPLELAINSRGRTRNTPAGLLKHRGWHLVEAWPRTRSPFHYRNYIQDSFAEWSVAKGGYVQGLSGWFSERSACYLAAGRPVVLQDTGFSEFLPTGTGLMAFEDVQGAVEGLRSVRGDYHRHSRAAREIAWDCFAAEKVLAEFIAKAS